MTGQEWNPVAPASSRRVVACLVVAALLAVLPATSSAQQLAPAQVEALKAQVQATGGRVIVQVKPNQGPRLQSNGRSAMSEQALAAVQARLQQRGLRNARRVNLVPLVFGEVTDAELEALLTDPNVLSVEPDVEMPLAEWRTSSFSEAALNSLNQSTPWGIDRVTAPAAWALQSPALDGKGIKIAFMDSGGDINHPDLQFAGGYDATTGSTSASAWNDDLSVCNGHGTHVAGTIGALNNGAGVVGVAPGASLYPIKVFRNSNGSCLANVSHQISGLNWAVNQGIQVVSVSIGGSTYVSSYEQAISAAASAGTFVVAAAGNNGTGALTYPGRYANALAIGGTDADNNRASWSNYGAELFAVAPGTSIYSTMPGSGYGYKSGTSMATPHAAGVVALVLAADPGASRSQVQSRLQQGALDLGAAGRDDLYGYGLTRAFESISGGTVAPPPPPPPAVPLALSLSPSSRSASTVAGSSSTIADSGTVTLSGDGSGTTSWTASKRKAWTTLTTASGTGSGKVRWTRNPSGLSAGTYVDTVTVSAGGLSSRIIDTLVVTTAPVPLALSLSPTSRSASTVAGSSSTIADSGTVTLSGDGSSSTGWTASKRKAWTTLTSASGTGSGKVRWTRNPSGLSAGTYVDTVTVSAGGLSSRIIDTLVITAAPVPLAMTVSPTSRSASAVAGSSSTIADSGTVTLSGDGSSTTSWTASKRKAWTTLTTASGTGSGKVRWTRNPSGLSAGTYVDTVTVSAGGLSSRIIDTLVVTAAPVPLAMTVSPTSRSASTVAGSSSTIADSGTVALSGDGSGSTNWTAAKRKAWTTLTTASGTGSGTVRWSRNPSGLVAGTYVDTVTVTAGGISKRVIDSLVITAAAAPPPPAPEPLTLAVSPGSRKVTTDEGSTTSFETSATVSLNGDGSSSAAWTASKRKAWTTLTTANGTGSGTVAWSRSGAGLAAGTYVDTITVAVNGLSARIIDSLVVHPVALKLSVTPRGRKAQGKAGTAEIIADSGDVLLTGTGSSTATWTASRRSEWLNLLTVSGVGSGKIRWTRNTSGLAAGTYVDTITVVTAGVAEALNTIIDTLVMSAAPGNGNNGNGGGTGGGNAKTKPVGGKKTSVSSSTAQAVEIVFDSIEVYLDQENAPAFTWSATSNAAWLQLSRTSGSGGQHVSWSRDAETLPAGLHIGQITVRLLVQGAEYTVAFADTVIAGVEDPGVTRAAEELFDPTNLNEHQRRLLDQLGNRNGLYDLGDFLAWVEYTGTTPHASLMARVMALPPVKAPEGVRQPDPRK